MAVIPDPLPPAEALTRATVKARRTHPTTSFPTPAERTTIPTVVSRSLSSVMIRHRTGKAVMDMATYETSKRSRGSALGEKTRGKRKKRRTRRTRSNEQQEVTERNSLGIDELVVDGNGDLPSPIESKVQESAKASSSREAGRNKKREKESRKQQLTAAPNPKGRIIPAAEIETAALAFLLTTETSTSSPTMNRKRTKPARIVNKSSSRETKRNQLSFQPAARPPFVSKLEPCPRPNPPTFSHVRK